MDSDDIVNDVPQEVIQKLAARGKRSLPKLAQPTTLEHAKLPHNESCPSTKSADACSETAMEYTAMSEGIEFQNILVYLPALQVCTTVTVASAVIVGMGALQKGMPGAAIRTLGLVCSLVFFFVGKLTKVCSVRPIRGVSALFESLRPVCLFWIMAVVCMQLSVKRHDCREREHVDNTDGLIVENARHSFFTGQNITFQIAVGCLCMAAIARTFYVQSDGDAAVATAGIGVVLMCIFPSATETRYGILENTVTAYEGIYFCVRSVAFTVVYTVLVYGSPPARHTCSEIFICSVKALTGSLWVLLMSFALLAVCLLQCALVIYICLSNNRQHLFGNDDVQSLCQDTTMSCESNNSDSEGTQHEMVRSRDDTFGVGSNAICLNTEQRFALGPTLTNGAVLLPTKATNGQHVSSNCSGSCTYQNKQEKLAEVARRLEEGTLS